jgi:hypothetical protein
MVREPSLNDRLQTKLRKIWPLPSPGPSWSITCVQIAKSETYKALFDQLLHEYCALYASAVAIYWGSRCSRPSRYAPDHAVVAHEKAPDRAAISRQRGSMALRYALAPGCAWALCCNYRPGDTIMSRHITVNRCCLFFCSLLVRYSALRRAIARYRRFCETHMAAAVSGATIGIDRRTGGFSSPNDDK